MPEAKESRTSRTANRKSGSPPPAGTRRHRGDIMSPKKRSAVMSRIRGRDTGVERALAGAMSREGWSWEEQCRDLPGRPDFVFRDAEVAVFVDGDFWHGWKFENWRDKLSEKWEAKIEANIRRDRLNRGRLRRMGWKVVRVWEHQIEKGLNSCIARIRMAVSVGNSVKKPTPTRP